MIKQCTGGKGHLWPLPLRWDLHAGLIRCERCPHHPSLSESRPDEEPWYHRWVRRNEFELARKEAELDARAAQTNPRHVPHETAKRWWDETEKKPR